MRQEKYDVVVIGSGLGGLSAAALLANGGYKTLVLEKLPFVGGRCSSMKYKGFDITTGAIAMASDGGPIEQVFKEVGAQFDLKCPYPFVWYRKGGKDYLPPEQGTLRWLVSLGAEDEAEVASVMDAFRRGMGWEEPSDILSVKDWLLQYTRSKGTFGVFQGFIGANFMMNSWEFPIGEYFHFIKEMGRLRKWGFAPRGNLNMMESLAEAIRNNNGDVWTRSSAKRIIINDGTAQGVIAERDGNEIEITAQAVISNAGPKNTVNLAGSENFDKGYLKEMAETLRPAPIIMLSIAADKPFIEHPMLIITDARRVNCIICPTLSCPELAPEGKHLLEVGCAPLSSIGPINFKQEMEFIMEDIRENLPDFDKNAEILLARRHFANWPGSHTWSGYDLSQRTPLENLYNVGDGVKPSGYTGTSASTLSGRIVAEEVKKRISPR